MKPIYLDYNASTPIAPEVAEAMRPFLSQHYGNPSSHHWAGASAKQALEKARNQVAALLGCSPQEIVFPVAARRQTTTPSKAPFSRCARKATTSSRPKWSIRPCFSPAVSSRRWVRK
jgi:cysteine desulfurase